jgi:hypothetical protein
VVDFIQKLLNAKHDARKAIADPKGRYYGGEIEDTSLTPISRNPRIAPTRYDSWLTAHSN